jgi:hypothetical protein
MGGGVASPPAPIRRRCGYPLSSKCRIQRPQRRERAVTPARREAPQALVISMWRFRASVGSSEGGDETC